MLIDCMACKDWKGCSGKDYFEPSEIHQYCFHQVIFLIVYSNEDCYPVRQSGYVDPGTHAQRSPHASFEMIKMLVGEVLARLRTCGEAGEALVDEVQNGVTDRNGLSRPARRVLSYIVGPKRRSMNYRSWLKQIKYRQKNEYQKVSLKL